jgi:hypothetical protein
MRINRTTILIGLAIVLSSVFGLAYEASSTPAVPCPEGSSFLEYSPDSPVGECFCPNGELLGNIELGGFVPQPSDDGDCSTGDFNIDPADDEQPIINPVNPSSVEDTTTTIPANVGPEPAYAEPDDSAYPLEPPAQSTGEGGGPVQANPGFTG